MRGGAETQGSHQPISNGLQGAPGGSYREKEKGPGFRALVCTSLKVTLHCRK